MLFILLTIFILILVIVTSTYKKFNDFASTLLIYVFGTITIVYLIVFTVHISLYTYQSTSKFDSAYKVIQYCTQFVSDKKDSVMQQSKVFKNNEVKNTDSFGIVDAEYLKSVLQEIHSAEEQITISKLKLIKEIEMHNAEVKFYYFGLFSVDTSKFPDLYNR